MNIRSMLSLLFKLHHNMSKPGEGGCQAVTGSLMIPNEPECSTIDADFQGGEKKCRVSFSGGERDILVNSGSMQVKPISYFIILLYD